MEIILVPAVMLAIAGVALASTADLHSCTKCGGVGTDDYGLMKASVGKKTIFNLRGTYWTHTSCSGLSAND